MMLIILSDPAFYAGLGILLGVATWYIGFLCLQRWGRMIDEDGMDETEEMLFSDCESDWEGGRSLGEKALYSRSTLWFPPPLSSTSKGVPSESQTTVVVGAGAIGLMTAIQLRERQIRAGRMADKVIVLEAMPGVFQQASGYNTGGIGCIGDQGPCLAFNVFSCRLYQEIMERNPMVARMVGYREKACFEFAKDNGRHGSGDLLDWVHVPHGMKVVCNDGGAFLHPQKFGESLRRHCMELHLPIICNSQPQSVRTHHNGQIKSLSYSDAAGMISHIDCHNLLLAAGPWTPFVYDKLFPTSSLRLKSIAHSGTQVILANPCPVSMQTIGAIFADEAFAHPHKFEMSGRHDGTIAALDRFELDIPIPPVREPVKPDQTAVKEILRHAKKLISGPSGAPIGDDLQVISAVHRFRPTLVGGLPLMAGVPTHVLLGRKWKGHEIGVRSGVFISTGHSRSGISMAAGAGRVMSQLIMGEEPEQDISAFGLPSD